jgi:hypothetical protein
MEKKYAAMIIIIIIVVLLAIGTFFGEQSIEINGCKAEWGVTDAVVGKSQLCSQDSCIARPEAQQYNAIVDALLCACGKASAVQYTDSAANKRIEDVIKNFFGYSMSAQQVCDDPGRFMTKRSYG